VWVVELRNGRRAVGPITDASAGEQVTLPAGGRLTLLGSYPDGASTSGRLWAAHVETDNERSLPSYLAEHGRPIAYSYVDREWPLEAYQTVFARRPGSAEMPSAA